MPRIEYPPPQNDKYIYHYIDGDGSVITTGSKGGIKTPFNCTIREASLFSLDDPVISSSAVVDIWKDTDANYPPTDSDSITGSAPLTISGDRSVTDSTLTDWTKQVTKGDWLYFNVDSNTAFKKLVVMLRVDKN